MTDTDIILLDPNDIVITEDRYRKDLGDMASLTDSIKTLGKNIIPILVMPAENGKYTLIAGERRTTACKTAGVKVRAIIESLDTIEHRIFEITENLERKDFDWKEKVFATSDLIDMLKAKYKRLPIRKASEKTGLSVGAISTDLGLVEALKIDPEMFARCKTRDSALKVLQKYKLDETYAELAIRKKKTNYGAKAHNYLFNGSCLDLIDNIPDGIINALITDPPYGIDIDKVKKHSETNIVANQSNTYVDDVKGYLNMMELLFNKLGRVMAKSSCFCFFCDHKIDITGNLNLMDFMAKKFAAIGFDVAPLPAIWHRSGSPGQVSNPNKHFASSYETFIYGSRGDYSIIKRGQSNVLPFAGVPITEKMHVVEKPLVLMEELVNRFCLPGNIILDPFAGSATTIIAGLKAGCKAIGFELDEVNYNRAIIRIADFLSAKDAGLLNKAKEG